MTNINQYNNTFKVIKNIASNEWKKSPLKDKLPIFRKVIDYLNKLDFVFTGGSCSGHVENPFLDSLGKAVQRGNIVAGVYKKGKYIYAPRDYSLCVFGFVGFKLNINHPLSKEFANEAAKLINNYFHTEIKPSRSYESGIMMYDLVLRFLPWPGLIKSGYVRYDFYDLYLAKNKDAKIIESQFINFWKKLLNLIIIYLNKQKQIQ